MAVAVGAGLIGGAVTGLFTGGVATAVAVGLGTAALAAGVKELIPDVPASASSNQELTIGKPEPRMVVGETVISGGIIKYEKVKQGKREWQHFYMALVPHKCESVVLYQVDGKRTSAMSGEGYYLEARLGNQTGPTARSLSLMSNVDSTFIGTNATDVYCEFVINEKIWPNGVQDLKFKVRGVKVYDPRKDDTVGGSGTHRLNDETTWEWSDNAALINFWWKKFKGAVVLDDDLFDLANIAAEANICDELQAVTDSQGNTTQEKRYTCNGVFNLSSGHEAVENQLLTSCAGKWIESTGGKYRLQVAAYRGPAIFTITENHLARAPYREPFTSLSSKFNIVNGSFIDKNAFYQDADITPIRSQDMIDNRDAGVEYEDDNPLLFTQTESMAQRLGVIKLLRNAAGDSIKLVLKRCYANFVAGAVVYLNMPEHLLVGNYEIEKSLLDERNGQVELEIKETSADMYNQAQTAPDFDATPNFQIDNTYVAPVETLAYTPTPDSSVRQGVLTWDHPLSDSVVRYVITIEQAGTVVKTGETLELYYNIANLPVGNYTALVYAVNTFGKTSEAISRTFSTVVPSTPTGQVGIQVLPGRVIITGPALPNSSSTYEWRYYFSDNFSNAFEGGLNKVLTVTNTPPNGTLYVWYRIVDGDLVDPAWVQFAVPNLVGISSEEITPELIADLVLPESIFSIKDTFASIASDLQQASNQYSQTSGDYILLAQSVTDLNGDLGLVKLDVQTLQNAKATFDAEITLTNFLNAGFGYEDEFGNYVEGAAFVRALEEYRIENNTGQFVSLYNYFNALETRTGDLEGIYQFGIETYGGFTGIEIKNGTAAESSIRIFTDNWVFASQDGRVGYQYSAALGRHIWYGATVHIGTNEMSVEDFDQPFGPDNLTYWRGPVLLNLGEPDLSQLTKANATEWRDETGAKYTAGDFTAKGVLESSALKAGSGVILNDEGLTGPPIIYTFASGRSNDRVDRTLTMPILYGPGYVVTPNVAHSNYRLSYYNMDMFLKVIYTKSAGTSTVSNYEIEVKYTFQPSDPTGPTYPSGHNQWVTVVTGSVNPLHDYAAVPLIYRYTTRSEPWDTLQIRILVTSASGEGKPLSVLGELTVFNQSRSSNTPGTISSDSYESPSNNEPDYDDIYVPPGYIAP